MIIQLIVYSVTKEIAVFVSQQYPRNYLCVGINFHDKPIHYWTLHVLFSILK
jgi:hypothetical protein